jgi:hypothetical protein
MNPGEVFSWDDLASESAGGSEESTVNSFAYALNPGDLTEGTNTLAVEVHQQAVGSSDLAIDVKLGASKPSGGGGSGATLTQTGPVRARALNGAEWSALTEATFIVGTPASGTNLVISEIFYNPPGGLEDTEFLELMNISPGETIDLTGVTLTGISYAFPEGFTLAPQQRVVIVKNRPAFDSPYNTAGMNIAPGDFGGTSLDNGGEEIAIIAQDDSSDIQRFTYDDATPWPEDADGSGASLVLINPESSPDHSLPSNWRSSTTAGGNPGTSDASTFSGDPRADDDGDGFDALLEYALGSDDLVAGDSTLPTVSVTAGTEQFLTLSFQRNLAADDLSYEIEVATDLTSWSAATTLVSSTNNGDGTANVVYRSNHPSSAQVREFIRLRVTLNP